MKKDDIIKAIDSACSFVPVEVKEVKIDGEKSCVILARSHHKRNLGNWATKSGILIILNEEEKDV